MRRASSHSAPVLKKFSFVYPICRSIYYVFDKLVLYQDPKMIQSPILQWLLEALRALTTFLIAWGDTAVCHATLGWTNE